MDSAIARRAGVVFESMLLEMALKPLAANMDALGDYGIGLLAQEIAKSDVTGFGDALAHQLGGVRER
jgi:hypothetical protein